MSYVICPRDSCTILGEVTTHQNHAPVTFGWLIFIEIFLLFTIIVLLIISYDLWRMKRLIMDEKND